MIAFATIYAGAHLLSDPFTYAHKPLFAVALTLVICGTAGIIRGYA